jgi:pyruvate carboxylase
VKRNPLIEVKQVRLQERSENDIVVLQLHILPGFPIHDTHLGMDLQKDRRLP